MRFLRVKYHKEKFHPALGSSLRRNERPTEEAGDPLPVKRDMHAEQEAAQIPPDRVDERVIESESDQGRTR